MYFVINELNNLDRVYQFSMANYMYILVKGIHLGMPKKEEKEDEEEAAEGGEGAEKEKPKEGNSPEEITALLEVMSVTIFQYITQGLFERHKLIAASQFAFKMLSSKGELDAQSLDHLLKGPRVKGKPNPLGDWLPDSAWEALSEALDACLLSPPEWSAYQSRLRGYCDPSGALVGRRRALELSNRGTCAAEEGQGPAKRPRPAVKSKFF